MNSNDSKMQRLHQLAVKGETLTAEEQNALQNWYEVLDNEEGLALNNFEPIQSSSELRKNLTNITNQVAQISNDVKKLISQNDKLRKENQALKKSLESQLLEKVA